MSDSLKHRAHRRHPSLNGCLSVTTDVRSLIRCSLSLALVQVSCRLRISTCLCVCVSKFTNRVFVKIFYRTRIFGQGRCRQILEVIRENLKIEKLFFTTLSIVLCLTPPTEGFPWDDLRKILPGCQQMASVPNGVERLAKISIA